MTALTAAEFESEKKIIIKQIDNIEEEIRSLSSNNLPLFIKMKDAVKQKNIKNRIKELKLELEEKKSLLTKFLYDGHQ